MPFVGSLEYKKSDTKRRSFVGRQFYLLTEELRYYNDAVKVGYVVTCPVGFETDFASIPKFIPFLNAKDPRWQKAAVVHDRACKIVRETDKLSMKEADLYLYHAMLECGSNKAMASIFYLWVRAKHFLFRQNGL